MVSMAEYSEYVLEPLREGADFTLYRGEERANQRRILAVAVAAEQPSPQSIRRLEHEYSLAAELDATWAAQPLTLVRHQGRVILVLKDPGGEPLEASEILSLALIDHPIKGVAARLLESEDHAPWVATQRGRLSGPCRIEFSRERVFVFEPADTLRRGLFGGDGHRQDPPLVGAFFAAVESEVRPFAKRLQYVL